MAGSFTARAGTLIALLTALAACAGSRLPSAPLSVSTTSGESIGAGDVVEVRVLGEKELSGLYQVDIDGSIPFPFLGQLKIAGLGPGSAAAKIAEDLKARGYLVDPQVAVFVQQANSRRITLLGAINKAGTLPVSPGVTLLQAVSQAGGFTALASKDDTVITRNLDGKLKKFRVEVTAIVKGDAPDVPLQAGDVVYVPERMF